MSQSIGYTSERIRKILRRYALGISGGVLLLALAACSPRLLIVQGVADELAHQGSTPEDDLILARDASAFYLKLSESLLRDQPGHVGLATAVASGYTQYAYAFVAFEADRVEGTSSQAAQVLRQRAARLYLRAHRHAMAALEARQPGFAAALASPDAARWPRLPPEQIGLAYWGAASWGGYIALSKDSPDAVADLPLAVRLATLAYQLAPDHAEGALASLMGSFEMARAGGSPAQAQRYFDHAIQAGNGRSAGVFVAKAEGWALPGADRAAFEALLQQALAAARTRQDLPNEIMRERATWLLGAAPDLF
jgi:predicted anti-sigma-YlaC factor YlaD